MPNNVRSRRRWGRTVVVPAMVSALTLGLPALAHAGTPGRQPGGTPAAGMPIAPGNLLVTTSRYVNDPAIVAGQTALPPGCSDPGPSNSNCQYAVADGDYPYVFNNDTVDGSFGVTSPITIEELSPSGQSVGSLQLPDGSGSASGSGDDIVTSFSSKSELALNLSTKGDAVTFMGYDAPVGTVDVSNDNTPGDVDPTNPVNESTYRVVAQLDADGRLQLTRTNAYSGNNGRAAILDDSDGADVYYTAGNAGNGSNPEPEGIVTGAGAQLVQPSTLPESQQTPGQPDPIGSFNVMQQLGYPKEKVAKDDNFRGIAIDNGVVYYTKGSGGNGVNSVYFVDTTGNACPSGSGLPVAGAPLPTTTLSYDASEGGSGNPGLTPQDMCILNGFPTASAKNADDASLYPFGIWFANPDTLYVADEGSGDNTYSTTTGQYSAAAASTTAGLQKWVLDKATGTWNLAYTLQSGLDLGQPYTVPGYPTGTNSATGLPWAPATDGLRNLTGRVNPNGTVTLYAVTSTVSGGGDQGADPNQLVSITDQLGATTAPASEHFTPVQRPQDEMVVRGVSLTPGTTAGQPLPGGPGQPGSGHSPYLQVSGFVGSRQR